MTQLDMNQHWSFVCHLAATVPVPADDFSFCRVDPTQSTSRILSTSTPGSAFPEHVNVAYSSTFI